MTRMLITFRKNREVGMAFDRSLALRLGHTMVRFTTGKNFFCSTTQSRAHAIAKAISDEMGNRISEGMMWELHDNPEQPGFRANFFLSVKIKTGVKIDDAIRDTLDVIKKVCNFKSITIVERG